MSGSCCGGSAKSEPNKVAMTSAVQATEAAAKQPAEEFQKKRMLRRQAGKERKARLRLLDLCCSLVVKGRRHRRPFVIALRPLCSRQACRSPFFCKYSSRLTSPRA